MPLFSTNLHLNTGSYMKTTILAAGPTKDALYSKGIELYINRLNHYAPVEFIETPAAKMKGSKPQPEQVAMADYEHFTKHLDQADFIALLDEKGREYTSKSFAGWLQKRQNSGLRQLVLVIGGPYGFAEELRQRAHTSISLSQMTLTHQMVRLLAVEQLYRAHTILRGESYHHDQ